MGQDGIFPTFFLSGFECSSFDWKDQGRRDVSAELQHYVHADEDYRFLASLGIGVARFRGAHFGSELSTRVLRKLGAFCSFRIS